mmetsp:Transcript_9299/g.22847  ORF Transcript_9299/g.22847 Transcript_9299/m.22847 type:complete len:355 (+) Transcript_9299:2167-3231(+)
MPHMPSLQPISAVDIFDKPPIAPMHIKPLTVFTGSMNSLPPRIGVATTSAPGIANKLLWSTSPGRLNKSSIFFVTIKPPTIFTADIEVAVAARRSVPMPPFPSNIIPPSAVAPEIALVTDMSGVCRACATPITTWYPAAPASVKLLSRAGGTPVPMAMIPAPVPAMMLAVCIISFLGSTFSISFASTTLGLLTGVGCGGGGIANSLPSLQVTILRTMMSPSSPAASAASTAGKKPSAFSLPCTWLMKLYKFCAYMDDAILPILPGRSSNPMIVTPLSVTTVWPGLVMVQLPPPAAAKSTITEPGFIAFTMWSSISFGLGLPGMAAVVITMSHSLQCFVKVSFCAFKNSGLDSFA